MNRVISIAGAIALVGASCVHRELDQRMRNLSNQENEKERTSFYTLGDQVAKISNDIDQNKLNEDISHSDADNDITPGTPENREDQGAGETKDSRLSDEKKKKKIITTTAVVGGSVVVGGVVISAATKAAINRAVLPAAYFEPDKLTKKWFEQRKSQITELLSQEGSLSESVFQSKDGKVNVIEMKPTKEVTGYIIAMNGNGGHYQGYIDELFQLAQKTGMGVVAFNYPSGARSADQVIAIGTALSEQYVDKVGAKNVVLKGHSIGGAFASHIAENLHKSGKPVGLITDRSFTRLDTVVEELIGVPRSVASAILWATGWRLEPEKAIKNIPPQSQHHFYIDGDGIIKGKSNTRFYQGVTVEEIEPTNMVTNGHLKHNMSMGTLRTKAGQDFLQSMSDLIKRMK